MHGLELFGMKKGLDLNILWWLVHIERRENSGIAKRAYKGMGSMGLSSELTMNNV